jgi:hypothetical protein
MKQRRTPARCQRAAREGAWGSASNEVEVEAEVEVEVDRHRRDGR